MSARVRSFGSPSRPAEPKQGGQSAPNGAVGAWRAMPLRKGSQAAELSGPVTRTSGVARKGTSSIHLLMVDLPMCAVLRHRYQRRRWRYVGGPAPVLGEGVLKRWWILVHFAAFASGEPRPRTTVGCRSAIVPPAMEVKDQDSGQGDVRARGESRAGRDPSGRSACKPAAYCGKIWPIQRSLSKCSYPNKFGSRLAARSVISCWSQGAPSPWGRRSTKWRRWYRDSQS